MMGRIITWSAVVGIIALLVLATWWHWDSRSRRWWEQVRTYLSFPLQQRWRSLPFLQEAQSAMERQDLPRAERALRGALEIDPTNQEAWQLLVMILVQQGRVKEAEELAQKVADPQRRAQILLAIADVLHLRDDFEQADAIYRKVLALDPNNHVALNNYGYLLAERGVRLDEAERMIRKALRLRPDEPAYLDSLGWVYYQRGEYRRALPYIERSARMRPNDAEVRYHLGMVYWRLGDRLAAQQELEAALRLNPNYRPAREALEALKDEELDQEMRGSTIRT